MVLLFFLVSFQYDLGQSKIERIASKGSVEDYTSFIAESKMFINKQNLIGRTPVFYAAKHGNTAFATLLIDNGSDLTIRDYYKFTILHEAVLGGNYKMVNLLLEKGADPNARDKYGTTPCTIISFKTDEQAIRKLLHKQGALDCHE